jgi:hypothetical protein
MTPGWQVSFPASTLQEQAAKAPPTKRFKRKNPKNLSILVQQQSTDN